MVIFSILSGEMNMQRNNPNISILVCTTVLHKYMKLLISYVNNTHARIKIYREFYPSIVYIANEGNDIRIKLNYLPFKCLSTTSLFTAKLTMPLSYMIISRDANVYIGNYLYWNRHERH